MTEPVISELIRSRYFLFAHLPLHRVKDAFSSIKKLSSRESEFSRQITGENNTSWLVSIKHNGRIYEATKFRVLMEVTVVHMFRLLRHSYRVLFLLSGAV